jgi:hypothetical protein
MGIKGQALEKLQEFFSLKAMQLGLDPTLDTG